MFRKIVLGTANFTHSYGILSKDRLLSEKEITSILNKAFDKAVGFLDTAIGYGDITKIISANILKKFKIITKISVLDSKDELREKMDIYKGLSIYGLLIHDPCNLTHIDENDLLDKLNFLKNAYGIEKIGVSAYDINDIEAFSHMYMPEIVQIPLNPLNQSFDTPSFLEWSKSNKVEVHARSLFLQGVLLASELPKKLEPMRKEWNLLQTALRPYNSPLRGLLHWAASKSWIHNWVVGVSSLRDLDEILEILSEQANVTKIPMFQPLTHPLADPRNWQ